MPSAADLSRRALDGPALEALVDSLADVGGDGPSDLDLLAVLHQLERVKAAVAAAQARVTVTFAASQERAAQAARHAAKGQGFEAWRAARDRFPGVGEQVGLARRLSPWQGRAQLTFATDLLTDLPCTLAALTTGAISEWRAGIIARETTWLSAADRLAVDAEVAGDRVALARLGNRELTRAVTAAAYRRDPQGALARARAAENDRNVSIRPKPDAMCRISALLPVAQGVATYAALSQAADAARAEGDPRSRGQVLADTVVERVTGQTSAAAVPVEVQVVLSDAALLGSGAGAEHPAQVPGYGTVPAGWARDLIRGGAPTSSDGQQAKVWLRRLYATPDARTLVAMESGRRLFDAGLRRFLLARDGTCRTPWCDAPIRHLDHVTDHAAGGATSDRNGQGLCEQCNHTKQLAGWQVETVDPSDGQRAGPHSVRWITPAGLAYESQAPPLLPGTRTTVITADSLGDSAVEIAFCHAHAA